MIRSKYLPDGADCIAAALRENFSELPKIEVPADVYDVAVAEFARRIRNGAVDGLTDPNAAKNFVLRGNYTYETVKAFARADIAEALRFDEGRGEIVTPSKVGISAEVTFALAVWNGYEREDAVDRAILSSLKNDAASLPELLAEKISQVTIDDGKSIEKALAKALTGKARKFIVDKVKAGTDIGSESVDEVGILFRHGEDVMDLTNDRISGKQFVKNTAIILVGMAGTATILANNVLPGGAFVSFLTGFAVKLWAQEKAKNFLDKLIEDDSTAMLEIFGDELAKILDGKFLTQYELEILTEALHDALNKNILKDMFALDNREEQAAFARAFIEQRLAMIFGQRRFIVMPSSDEWAQGLQRVTQALEDVENFSANMERTRQEALARRRTFLGKYNLKPYDAAPVVQAVNEMTKTDLQVRRVMQHLAQSENLYKEIHRRQMNTRADTKDALQKILSDM